VHWEQRWHDIKVLQATDLILAQRLPVYKYITTILQAMRFYRLLNSVQVTINRCITVAVHEHLSIIGKGIHHFDVNLLLGHRCIALIPAIRRPLL
jgi:hypothetical protein